jgi:(p)ppGpp synthase/HD superfamily hydrolase
MTEMEALTSVILAPWIYKATALIGVPRHIGGNQFRHSMATMSILIDYHYVDSVLLKAAVIHDLIEDSPSTDIAELRKIDADAEAVLDLVLENTRKATESKSEFLKRILEHGSRNAKILKCADRISNLTDLHYGIFSVEKMLKSLYETESYIIPMARQINPDMLIELEDLVKRRREILENTILPLEKTNKNEDK